MKKAIAKMEATFLEDARSNPEIDSRDQAVPFLNIIQSNSPQLEESSADYIEGSKSGMMFDSSTGELFGKDGVDAIPISYKKCFIEWVPRDQGGGFVKEWGYDEGAKLHIINVDGKDVLDNGNQLADTRTWVALIKGVDGFSPMAISMASTNITVSKKWTSLWCKQKMLNIKTNTEEVLPMFSTIYHITTKLRERAGNKWYVFNVTKKERISEINTYTMAKRLVGKVAVGRPQNSGATPSEETPF